jgi:hypothetical protein
MKATSHTVCAVGISLLLGSACGTENGQPATQQSEQAASSQTTAPGDAASPVAPAVSFNAAMVALVDHAAHNLWEVEREGNAPKTDEQWATVEEHAIQLAAAGPVFTVAGTGPNDPEWARNASWRSRTQAMTRAANDALTAARAKNMDQLKEANGRLVESCESCHKEFKPDLPSEGIVHRHQH